MADTLDALTEALLDAAKRAGADAADAMAVDGTSVSIDVRQGALEQAERSEGIDIGLRVLIGQKQACVSSSDVKPDTIAQMAERAVAMAKEAPEDPHIGLADASQLAQNWDVAALELADPAEEPDPAHLQDAALRAEAAALSHAGITQVQSASAGYGRRRIHLTASNGFSGGYTRTDNGLSCVAITGTGTEMERDYDGDFRVFASDMRTPEEIGHQAATRALERAGARKPKTGSYPILFDERISSSLIGHLLAASNGTNVTRGASWLRDAMGEAVLPDGLTLTENPHRKRMPSSKPFDAEGLPTAARNIVENGVLTQWTLDLAHARKLGLESTGNAARGTSAPPSPSVGNIELTQGDKTRDDLLKEMGTGLLVTSMIGSTINPTTGDYSRGAAGFWVENGEPVYAVNECTIAGNLRDMLRRIIPANDARTYLSRVVPSLLIEGMTLAGE
ncbi:MAG: metallopeptidase TldD-related protein [Pseudomonadota bacterium]